MANERKPQRATGAGQNRILILLLAFALLTSAFKDLDRLQSVTRRLHSVTSSWAQLGSTLYASEIEPVSTTCPEALAQSEKSEEFEWVSQIAGQTPETKSINGGITAEPACSGEIAVLAMKKNRQTKGYARTRALSNVITAKKGSTDWKDALEFKNVKGGIDFEFPRTVSTTFDVEAFEGDNPSHFPSRVLGRVNRRRVTVTIEDARPEPLLKTLNGAIRIRRVS